MDDIVVRLATRIGSVQLLDVPSRVEVLALASFSCCLLGDLGEFPLASNLAVAVLALVACRSRSEAQLVAFCGFAIYTTITDVIFMCTIASSWGGAMTTFNIVLKLAAATNAYKMCATLSTMSGEELGMGDDDDAYPSAAYQAPPNLEGETSTQSYRAI